MATKLKFINRSLDGGQSKVLLFQRNHPINMTEFPIAWRVIENCGYQCYHPFSYSYRLEFSINDERGNYTPHVPGEPGQLLSFGPGPLGPELTPAGAAPSASDIQVLNAQAMGAMDVNVFRNGLLVARKTAIAPQQKAVFQFRPSLWIGVASEVEQGQSVDAAIVSDTNTELMLLGIAQADIVMTGGGGGRDARPFTFALDNVVRA